MENKPGILEHQPLLPSESHICNQTEDNLPLSETLYYIFRSQMNLFLKIQGVFYCRTLKKIITFG